MIHLDYPVPNIRSQNFGDNPQYYAALGQRGHNGIDFAVPSGTPVKASADGVIRFEGWGQNFNWMGVPAGICIVIDHGEINTGYAHLTSTLINSGQRVTRGQVIGYTGSTGQATGPHLHFEVISNPQNWNNGYASRINPEPYLASITPPVPVEQLQGYQRKVGSSGVNYRKAPSSGAELVETFLADHIYDFKGYVRGESIDGNNVWFVGKYSGHYAWSGGFTDTGTHDLADLTPSPQTEPTEQIQGYQRVVGESPVNYRKAPNRQAEVVDQFKPGYTYDFKGYVHGENIDGNDIWFVGRYSENYVWSGGFNDSGIHDLPNLTDQPQNQDPDPEKPYEFVKDVPCVTEVDPVPRSNFQEGNFPEKPVKVVIHDFGTKGRDTFGSTKNEFNRLNAEKSAHFVVSKKNIVQMVSLRDRAFHAGANGNDFVGIETDPDQDDETIESVRTLLQQLKVMYGYKLIPIKHSEIMVTSCGDDVDLVKYNIDDVPSIPENPEEKPVDPNDPQDGESAKNWLLRIIQWILSILDKFKFKK